MYVKNETYQFGIKLCEHLISRFTVGISHKFKLMVMIREGHACRMKLFDSRGKLLNELLDAVLAAVFFFDPADSDILAAESLAPQLPHRYR